MSLAQVYTLACCASTWWSRPPKEGKWERERRCDAEGPRLDNPCRASDPCLKESVASQMFDGMCCSSAQDRGVLDTRMETSGNNNLCGVGINFRSDSTGALAVHSLVPLSPAAEDGQIREGDLLEQVAAQQPFLSACHDTGDEDRCAAGGQAERVSTSHETSCGLAPRASGACQNEWWISTRPTMNKKGYHLCLLCRARQWH